MTSNQLLLIGLIAAGVYLINKNNGGGSGGASGGNGGVIKNGGGGQVFTGVDNGLVSLGSIPHHMRNRLHRLNLATQTHPIV